MLTSNRPSTITRALRELAGGYNPDHGRPDLAKPFYQRLHPVLLDALTKTAVARASLDKLAFRLQRAVVDRRSPSGRRRP